MLPCKQYIVFFYPVSSPYGTHMHISLPYDRPVIDERRLSRVSCRSKRSFVEVQGSTVAVQSAFERRTVRFSVFRIDVAAFIANITEIPHAAFLLRGNVVQLIDFTSVLAGNSRTNFHPFKIPECLRPTQISAILSFLIIQWMIKIASLNLNFISLNIVWKSSSRKKMEK